MPPVRVPPPPPVSGFDFQAVDAVDISEYAVAYCKPHRHIPVGRTWTRKDAENRVLRAHGIPLARIRERYDGGGPAYDPESDIELERALKWHCIQSEALLRQHKSGGKAGRREVASRLLCWETDGQRALLHRLHAAHAVDTGPDTSEVRSNGGSHRADGRRSRDGLARGHHLHPRAAPPAAARRLSLIHI